MLRVISGATYYKNDKSGRQNNIDNKEIKKFVRKGATFVFSYTGFCIGKRFGHFFEAGFESIGGLILIGIGVKILLEHLFV